MLSRLVVELLGPPETPTSRNVPASGERPTLKPTPTFTVLPMSAKVESGAVHRRSISVQSVDNDTLSGYVPVFCTAKVPSTSPPYPRDNVTLRAEMVVILRRATPSRVVTSVESDARTVVPSEAVYDAITRTASVRF